MKSMKCIKRNPLVRCFLYPAIIARRTMINYRNAVAAEKTLASLFDSVVEGSLVVRLPAFAGDFEIDGRSHLLLRTLKDKDYEVSKNVLVTKHVNPQRDAIDIGANVGFYTVLLSNLVSEQNKVLAVEPNPDALRLLRRNLARNGFSKKVTIFEGVAGKQTGIVTINAVAGMPEYSCVHGITHPAFTKRPTSSFSVPATLLDDLVSDANLQPGFIKIDAEGSEYDILQGGLGTLRKHRPTLLCEVRDDLLFNAGHSSQSVIDLLQEVQYDVVHIESPGTPITTPFSGDILAVPREFARH